MSAENIEANNTEGENWKNKYLRALMEQDNAEKEYEERFDSLYRELLVSFGHFRGQDQLLDKDIVELKKVCADQISFDNLKSINRKISNLVDTLNDDKPLESIENNGVNESAENDQLSLAKQVLSYLVEQLPEDVDKELDVESLITAVEQSDNMESLLAASKALKSTLLTLLDERSKKIAELLDFLSRIAKRLSGFKEHLKTERSGRKESEAERNDLSSLVQKNLKQIRESAAQADDMEALQGIIASRLDEVGDNMGGFLQAESRRADKAEKSSTLFEEKLQKLQAQTSKLKQSLQSALHDSLIDPLTEISNRRAYTERLDLECSRWEREKNPLTLAIMDIDHFKNINDSYGHPIGDKVLKIIADLIKQKTRESDFFGRIGGEEFAFIFIGSDIESSQQKLELLRKKVEACAFSTKKETFHVTISIGLAVFGEKDNAETLYSRADEALIKAKETGRNKTLSENDL